MGSANNSSHLVTLVVFLGLVCGLVQSISNEELEKIRKYGSMVLVRRPKSSSQTENNNGNNNNIGFQSPHQVLANQFLEFGEHGRFRGPINGIHYHGFNKPPHQHRFNKFGPPPPPHFHHNRFRPQGSPPNGRPFNSHGGNNNNNNGGKKPSASVDVFSFGFPVHKNSGPKFHRPRGPPPPRHPNPFIHPFHNNGPRPVFPSVNPTYVTINEESTIPSNGNSTNSNNNVVASAASTATPAVNSNYGQQGPSLVQFPGSNLDVTAHQQLMTMLNTLPPNSFYSQGGPPSFGFTPPAPFFREQGPPNFDFIHSQVPVSFVETPNPSQQSPHQPQLVEYYPNNNFQQQHVFVQGFPATTYTTKPTTTAKPQSTTTLPPIINVKQVDYIPEDIVAVVKTNNNRPSAEESFQQVIFDSVRDSQKQHGGFVAPVYNSEADKPSEAGQFLISHFYPNADTTTTASPRRRPKSTTTTTTTSTTTVKPTYHYVRTTIFPSKKPRTTTTTTTTVRTTTASPAKNSGSTSTTVILSEPVESEEKGPWILRNGKRARRVKKTKEVVTGPSVSPVYGKKVVTRVQSSSSSTSSSSENSNKKRYRLRKVKVEKAKAEDSATVLSSTTPTASSVGHQ